MLHLFPETSLFGLYRVHCHVASHVAWCDPIQHSSPGYSTQALGSNVENGSEKRHLWADKVGKSDGRVDVAAADVADGLDEGSGCQPKAQGHVKDMMRPSGPAQGSAHAKEHKKHGPEELGKNCPPKIHRPELPHGDGWGSPPDEEDSSKINLEKVKCVPFQSSSDIKNFKKESPFCSQLTKLTKHSWKVSLKTKQDFRTSTDESTQQIFYQTGLVKSTQLHSLATSVHLSKDIGVR